MSDGVNINTQREFPILSTFNSNETINRYGSQLIGSSYTEISSRLYFDRVAICEKQCESSDAAWHGQRGDHDSRCKSES